MEKRAFLAVILSIAVFYVFSFFFAPEKKTVIPPTAIAPSSDAAVLPKNTPPPETPQKQLPTTVLPTSSIQKEIVVDTPLYRAVFTSRGGSLKSLTVKAYREENAAKSPEVVLGSTSDPSVLTFSTRATGFDLSDSTLWQFDADAITLSGSESKRLVFSHVIGQGLTVYKVYIFNADSYGIKLDTQVLNNSAIPIVATIQHVMTYPAEPKTKDTRFETAGSYIFADKGLQSDKIKDVASGSKKYDKSVEWAGFADKYFLNAILTDKGSIAVAEIKKNASGFFELTASSPQITFNPGQTVTVAHKLFVGPKDIDVLLKIGGDTLVKSLDLGWFEIIAKPLLDTLKFFYSYVGNYGLAIIIITVILKILFFPLTHKSYKSMKDMQKIQPEMNKIREKYKDDRDAMNKAVMELYRDHKVNPMGGCLPMIVQIPVFFALYKALMFSIELRHAPFYLWVTDLSDKDPYYVTPIIMGVTMFIQQKMTPSQMDPIQQKMMLALPVVFTFMFLSFPSGLVLYWLVNNVLTIGQQMYINKLVKD